MTATTPTAATTDYAGFGMTAIVGPDTAILLAMEPNSDFVNELWGLVQRAAIWDDVIGVLLRGSIVALPAMGLVHRDGDATTVLLRGAMNATVTTRGAAPEVMNGARVTTWTERPFEDVTSVEFSGDPVAESEARLPVSIGVVRAGIVRRFWGSAPAPSTVARSTVAGEPAPGTQAAPAPAADGAPNATAGGTASTATDAGWPALAPLMAEPNADSAAAPAAVELGDHDHRTQPSQRPRPPRPPTDRSAAPRISAVTCANGHLNPPIAERCRICDLVIADDQVPVEIDQPPVGQLRVLPGGPAIPLRGRVLVGREPRWEGRDTNLGDGSNLSDVSFFVVESPDRTISRTHLEVRVTGWTVEAVDVSSSHTEVTNPGVAPLRLRRGSPAVILPGAAIVLADDVTLRYEVTE